MTFVRSTHFLFASLLICACGGGDRVSPGEEVDEDYEGVGDGPDGGCTPRAEVCSGGEDEDCDGDYDCGDADCNGQGDCPNCGELDLTEGEPLALPDGEGSSYESGLNFTGFNEGQTVEAVSNVVGVCVNMEHSWLRDLQIEIACPSGQRVVLQEFLGQTGSVVYMGEPIDTDGYGTQLTPGVGYEYCWTPTATNLPMLEYANANANPDPFDFTPFVLPAGDYQAVDPFDQLVGCNLNGSWLVKVTDLWAADNGFIFSWGVKFDPTIVEDCSDWTPE